MSDKQPNGDDSSQVETFRDVPGDEWSEEEEEESSGDSSGCLKIAYSYSDITEELIKNGGTLYQNVIQDGHRDDEPIYENVAYGADGSKSTFYDEYLDGWSSSEFDDSDEGSGQGQTETSGPRSFDFFKKKKKKMMILPKLSMGSGQDALMMMSKGKSSIFEGFRRNAMQSTVLDKISKFGQKRSKQDDPSEPDPDLQPLNFCVGNEEFKPACLPGLLSGDITSMQLKRRQIIGVIVESERSYLFSLKRLIEEYQLPLLQSQPSIIDRKHVKVIFHKVRDIIQCHLLFHGELHNVAKRWDEEEMIGDVFVASFSKSMVFEAYSSFVNNFPTAMDRAKKQARLKSTFNAFLQNKLDTSSDKLSLFGLMVKPIQRFPQFIMLIQDLLKNTPKDHQDRLSLQWALTELEMLTDRLNETKKECESLMEARRLYKALHLGGITNRPQEVQSLFIRQDDVMQHKVRDGETESKMKRLFMLSDQLVCASVNKNKETVDPSDSILSSGEKLVVSWSAPVKDIDVVDPTLPSLKNHPSISRQSSQSSGKKPSKISSPAPPTTTSNPYRRDLDNMLHDLTILEKMLNLHSHLILKYEALPAEYLKTPIKSLEMLIRQKIDIDKNIVIISIPSRSALLMDGVSNMMLGSVTSSISEQMSGRGRRIVTLEFSSLTMKHDWLIELQSAKLATDPNNFPAWFLSENDPLSSRNPRFMKELKVDVITKEDKKMTLKPLMTKKRIKDELNCCTYITLPCHNKIGSGMRHLWVCIGGRAAIVSLHTDQPFVVECFNITDGNIVASDCVVEPRSSPDLPDEGRSGEVEGSRREGREVVWMISDDNKIFMVPAIPTERQSAIKPMKVEGALVMCIKYLNNRVYLGASDGTLLIYTRNAKDEWNFASPQKLWVGNEAVSFLLVADDNAMWASCSSTVHILGQQASSKDSCGAILVKTSHDLTNDASFKNNGTPGKKNPSISIECMVKAGVGLLVSFADQSTVRLFHAETFRHLQDINVSSAVNQLLEEKGSSLKPEQLVTNLSITCMLQNKGILYIGTSQGFVLTLPLPRLNGMPQFRQRPAISFQGHVGPVRFLASINCSLVDSSADKQAKGNPKEVSTSHRASSDTLIDEEHLTSPSQKVSEPMESMKNGIHEPTIPPPVTPSLSSSTPDLTSLQTDHVDMKLQQMKVLYESLFRGVSENSDDSAVLQRIASTPLPRRRLQNIIKNVLVHDTTVTPPLIISSFNPENSDGMMRCRTDAKRIAKMRHSTSELLETPSVGARKILQQSIKTSAAAQSIEEESREQKSPIVHESEEKGTLKPNESHIMNDELIKKDEETRKMASHLNKSVSSASDTPSQKSSSSTSSSVKIQIQDEKFPSVSRFSVPSNTAMISSTLTTTPKSRATVFVSAGKGHVPWNSTSKSDGSPEKPCLLLWMC